MPTYIALVRYTDEGIKRVKQSPARVESNRESFQSMGVNMRQVYFVMGHYDAVAICEAPDDVTAEKAALTIAASGGVRFEVLRAFTEAEFRNIALALP